MTASAWYKSHRKFVVGLVGAGVTILAQYVAPQVVSDITLVLTALGVYAAPNEPV